MAGEMFGSAAKNARDYHSGSDKWEEFAKMLPLAGVQFPCAINPEHDKIFCSRKNIFGRN